MVSETLMVKAALVIPNRFLLTKILSDRVNQLQRGRKPKVEVEEKTPFLEIALQEIAEGKLELVEVKKTLSS